MHSLPILSLPLRSHDHDRPYSRAPGRSFVVVAARSIVALILFSHCHCIPHTTSLFGLLEHLFTFWCSLHSRTLFISSFTFYSPLFGNPHFVPYRHVLWVEWVMIGGGCGEIHYIWRFTSFYLIPSTYSLHTSHVNTSCTCLHFTCISPLSFIHLSLSFRTFLIAVTLLLFCCCYFIYALILRLRCYLHFVQISGVFYIHCHTYGEWVRVDRCCLLRLEPRSLHISVPVLVFTLSFIPLVGIPIAIPDTFCPVEFICYFIHFIVTFLNALPHHSFNLVALSIPYGTGGHTSFHLLPRARCAHSTWPFCCPFVVICPGVTPPPVGRLPLSLGGDHSLGWVMWGVGRCRAVMCWGSGRSLTSTFPPHFISHSLHLLCVFTHILSLTLLEVGPTFSPPHHTYHILCPFIYPTHAFIVFPCPSWWRSGGIPHHLEQQIYILIGRYHWPHIPPPYGDGVVEWGRNDIPLSILEQVVWYIFHFIARLHFVHFLCCVFIFTFGWCVGTFTSFFPSFTSLFLYYHSATFIFIHYVVLVYVVQCPFTFTHLDSLDHVTITMEISHIPDTLTPLSRIYPHALSLWLRYTHTRSFTVITCDFVCISFLYVAFVVVRWLRFHVVGPFAVCVTFYLHTTPHFLPSCTRGCCLPRIDNRTVAPYVDPLLRVLHTLHTPPVDIYICYLRDCYITRYISFSRLRLFYLFYILRFVVAFCWLRYSFYILRFLLRFTFCYLRFSWLVRFYVTYTFTLLLFFFVCTPHFTHLPSRFTAAHVWHGFFNISHTPYPRFATPPAPRLAFTHTRCVTLVHLRYLIWSRFYHVLPTTHTVVVLTVATPLRITPHVFVRSFIFFHHVWFGFSSTFTVLPHRTHPHTHYIYITSVSFVGTYAFTFVILCYDHFIHFICCVTHDPLVLHITHTSISLLFDVDHCYITSSFILFFTFLTFVVTFYISFSFIQNIHLIGGWVR